MHRLIPPLLFLSTVYSVAIIQTNDTYQASADQNQDFITIPQQDNLTEELHSDHYPEPLLESLSDHSGDIDIGQEAYDDTTNSTALEQQTITDIKDHEHKTCQMCKIRDEQKRHRVEAIKKRISHVLKLDVLGMPNTTSKRLPKVPSFLRLREKYENAKMQSDSPNSFKEERLKYQDIQEEYGQPERTYTFAKELPDDVESTFPNTIYFEMTLSPEIEAYKAFLWVYISTADVIDRNMTEIYVYIIDPPGKFGNGPTKREIRRRKRHYLKAAGWHHFDILDDVKRWTYRKHLNLGLVVEALDEHGNNMVVFPPAVGINEGYEPMLDIRTALKRTTRSKRSVGLYCDEVEQIACCRYPLVVDFVEFGWDFVIAPLTYHAYYCAGECLGDLESTMHGHSVRQSPTPTLSQPQSDISNIGPCCTPTKMSDLPMLFFDHNSNVEYTRLPRMKVDRCGCA